MQESIYARIVPCSHFFPGINLATVYDLPWRGWVLYALATDAWLEERRRAATERS